jgi:hypothetical protein
MGIRRGLMHLDHSFLLSVLNYDPSTGIFTWKVRRSHLAAGKIAGSKDPGHGYIRIKLKDRLYLAHRLAWFYIHQTWPIYEIDHLNGEKTDNRLANLRDVPRFINRQNIRSPRADNRHGSLGVSKERWGKNPWLVRVARKGKLLFSERFATKEEAAAAYIEAKRKFHEGNTL